MSNCDKCIGPEVTTLRRLVYAMLGIGVGIIALLIANTTVVGNYQGQVNTHVAEDKLRFKSLDEAKLETKKTLQALTDAAKEQTEAFNEMNFNLRLHLENSHPPLERHSSLKIDE
jgi:hypothetical protein